eukprot:scaffold285375_cov31-Tisochrysis_lutea.AAC.2
MTSTPGRRREARTPYEQPVAAASIMFVHVGADGSEALQRLPSEASRWLRSQYSIPTPRYRAALPFHVPIGGHAPRRLDLTHSANVRREATRELDLSSESSAVT